MGEWIKKINFGKTLSLIAFLIAILPATYNLVNSFREFVAVLQEAQKKIVITQQEQGKLLQQCVSHNLQMQSSPQQQPTPDQINEILERIKSLQDYHTVKPLPQVEQGAQPIHDQSNINQTDGNSNATEQQTQPPIVTIDTTPDKQQEPKSQEQQQQKQTTNQQYQRRAFRFR